MLLRLPAALCSTWNTFGTSRPRVCSLTNLRDIACENPFGSLRSVIAVTSTAPQRLPQRLFSRLAAWDDIDEDEQFTEYVPEPYRPNVPIVPTDQQELLQVGVVGAPNAGKSTLTNALVGTKVSAVSRKTNTTNVPMLGAWTDGTKQVVLFDTPGVVSPKQYRNAAQATRVSSAWGTASDCDLLLFIVDIHRQVVKSDPRVVQLVQDLSQNLSKAADALGQVMPAILVLNKVDLLKHEGDSAQKQMVRVAEQLSKLHFFEQTFWTSALRTQGVAKLQDYLMSRTTSGEWLMDAGQKTDRPPEQIVREVVREKLYRNLHQEVPYNAKIQPKSFKELEDGAWRFEQHIYVSTEHVKGMVVGRNGAVIGQIGKIARLELCQIFQKTVHLILHVKVIRKQGQ